MKFHPNPRGLNALKTDLGEAAVKLAQPGLRRALEEVNVRTGDLKATVRVEGPHFSNHSARADVVAGGINGVNYGYKHELDEPYLIPALGEIERNLHGSVTPP